MAEQFDYWTSRWTSRIPSIILYNGGMAATLKTYTLTWGALVGAALAVIYLLLAYLFLGIAALARLTRWRGGAAVAYIVATVPIVALAVIVRGEPTPRTQDLKEVQDNLAKMQKLNEMLTNINKTQMDASMAVVRNLR